MKKILVFVTTFLLFISTCKAYTSAPVDVTKMSLIEIKNALDKGYLTSETLVNIYLERISKYNEEFNAILFINEDALEEAQMDDSLRESGKSKGVLHGIPILVKTNIDVKGLPTTGGAKSLKDNMPNSDAEVIKKLKDAGAIIIASTNMSEFALEASRSYSSYGSVYNAYNSSYSSYGSSGGSAVSLALSFGAAALGTDTNSSVRVPSSAAGLVGFRPSFGLLSSDGIIPYDVTRDTVGTITKTVEDASLLMSVMSDTNYKITSSLKGVNIGVITDYYKGNNSNSVPQNKKTYTEVTSLVENSINKLKEQGANIIYIDDFLNSNYYNIGLATMTGSSMCNGFNNYIKKTRGTIRSFEDLVNSNGRALSLYTYYESCGEEDMTEFNEKTNAPYKSFVDGVYETYNLDVLIYPTIKNEFLKANEKVNSVNTPSSTIAPVLGYPAITIPMGNDKDGMPYGLEFVSLKNNEEKLLSISSSYKKLVTLEKTSLAPSLYEIPDEVEKLKNYYEEEKYRNTNEGKELISKTKDYFLNYNNNKNKTEEAKALIEKYKNISFEVETIEVIKKTFFSKNIIYVIIGIAVLLLLYKILDKQRKRNKRK